MPTNSENKESAGYRVLARKYRPSNFKELVGQDGMVQTLKNSIISGRIAHAFMLTGVRGVGKTTTARIIAKALNCVRPEGGGKETADPCGVCEPCKAISEDRHIDVIEMDAASRTGVDDIRELIDGVRYRPSGARFKIYIIDEVHMLSKNAFNALLKTLEEPPEHVKFIFATTEIRKVPITVLSRCQRFDLKRITVEDLNAHLQIIVKKENIKTDAVALQLISNAADGSVRDGLSLLDQAISLSDGILTGNIVQSMLGLVDRSNIYDLYEALMKGEVKIALETFSLMYENGAEPMMVLQNLLDVTYWVTRVKIDPNISKTDSVPEIEQLRGDHLANKVEMPTLTRNWQLILKGLKEASNAPAPRQAAEMVLVRLAYAADLPPASTLIATIEGDSLAPPTSTEKASPPGNVSPSLSVASGEAVGPAPDLKVNNKLRTPISPKNFEEVAALFDARKEASICSNLRRNVHLVHFKPGHIEIRPNTHAPRDLASRTAAQLSDWTGTRWVVSISQEQGESTLEQQFQQREQQKKDAVEILPAVQAIKKAFPGAAIAKVTPKSELYISETDDNLQNDYKIKEED